MILRLAGLVCGFALGPLAGGCGFPAFGQGEAPTVMVDRTCLGRFAGPHLRPPERTVACKSRIAWVISARWTWY